LPLIFSRLFDRIPSQAEMRCCAGRTAKKSSFISMLPTGLKQAEARLQSDKKKAGPAGPAFFLHFVSLRLAPARNIP